MSGPFQAGERHRGSIELRLALFSDLTEIRRWLDLYRFAAVPFREVVSDSPENAPTHRMERYNTMTSKDKVIIHVRFSPDGAVSEIGERPAGLDAQQWYNRLSSKAGSSFETLSGGRGFFRLLPEEITELKATALQ
jgi:hypothetical protein